jgi:hypothetical protein
MSTDFFFSRFFARKGKSMSDFDKAKQDPAGKKQRMAAADGKVYFRYATISNTMSRACALKQTQNENPNGFSEYNTPFGMYLARIRSRVSMYSS